MNAASGRGEVDRRARHVLRAAPASQRRVLRDRAVKLAIGLLAEAGLDPARAQDVDAHLGREGAREALAERQHAALDRGEQLRVLAGHPGRDVVPAHVHDRPAALLAAHDLPGRVRAGDRALEVDGQQRVELALPLPLRRLAGEHVRAGVVDPDVEPAEPLARLGDEALAAVARREVGLADVRAPAARRDRLGDRVRALGRRAVREQNLCALGGAGLGDRASDAAARAGDDGPEAVQPSASASPPSPPRTGGAPPPRSRAPSARSARRPRRARSTPWWPGSCNRRSSCRPWRPSG